MHQSEISQTTPVRPSPIRLWKNRRLLVAVLVVFLLVDAVIVMRIPNFAERVQWKLSLLRFDIRSQLQPQPPDMPTLMPQIAAPNESTQTAALPATPVVAIESQTDTPKCPPDGCSTPTPSPTVMPLPAKVSLAFYQYEYQRYNNCGPANLSMMLRFWGWKGSQDEVAAYTKPNTQDKNIMPYEMEDFVREKTDLGVMVRSGGTLDDLRRLIAGGFPPVIEKSVMLAEHNLGWMGHSLFLTGYDDDKQEFTGQDSYVGPNEKFSYTGIVSSWRPFNYHYIIAYPLEKEAEVRALLGTNADADANLLFTQDQALQETKSLHDSKDLAFAWYNVGTNYVDQRRYIDAAHAYDKARSLIIPWRIVWYETGIYKAYYWSQRYQDVIELANFTLNGETELEESWYWRGMARMALDDRDGAISDWRQALAKHAGFAPALVALSQANAAS